jgi:hypothetical protein
LNGHEHHYERFARQNPAGKKTGGGIREFVVGTGGIGRYPFAKAARNSEVRPSRYYELLKLTLRPGRYEWSFVSVDNKVRDRGSNICH